MKHKWSKRESSFVTFLVEGEIISHWREILFHWIVSLIKDPLRARLLWNKQKSGLLLLKGFLSFLSYCLAFGCFSFSFLCFFFSISCANFPNASKLIKKRISLTVCVFYLSIMFAEFLFILQVKFRNSILFYIKNIYVCSLSNFYF